MAKKVKKKARNSARVSRIILGLAFLFFGIAKLIVSPEQAAEVFGKIGGSYAQYFTAIYQIISAILVFFPTTAFIGALMISLSMIVAIVLHFTILGFSGPFLILTIVAFVLLILSIHVMRQTRNILGR